MKKMILGLVAFFCMVTSVNAITVKMRTRFMPYQEQTKNLSKDDIFDLFERVNDERFLEYAQVIYDLREGDGRHDVRDINIFREALDVYDSEFVEIVIKSPVDEQDRIKVNAIFGIFEGYIALADVMDQDPV